MGVAMLFAIFAYLALYYLALRNRRNVRLHSGYMLATALILFESPLGRVMLEHMPFLVFTSSEFPQRILDAIVIAMVLSIAFALVFYLRDRKGGVPFLLAAVFLVLESLAMYFGTSIELVGRGLKAEKQVPIRVAYKGHEVGEYFADIVVENQVILELKAVDSLQKIHEAQLLNYLKATGYKIGLLVNFSYPKAEIKRFIL